jgi:hypothetical protein
VAGNDAVAQAAMARWRLMCCRVRGEGTKAVGRVHRAGRSAAGLTQSAARQGGGGAVGRHNAVAVNGGGVGTVVTNDGALALHHGEGESEVR